MSQVQSVVLIARQGEKVMVKRESPDSAWTLPTYDVKEGSGKTLLDFAVQITGKKENEIIYVGDCIRPPVGSEKQPTKYTFFRLAGEPSVTQQITGEKQYINSKVKQDLASLDPISRELLKRLSYMLPKRRQMR